MSFVIVRCWPHIGQFAFLRSFISRNFMASASNRSSRPIKLSPRPRMSLIVSIAWIEPTIPGKTPSTPPSAQNGTVHVRLAEQDASIIDQVARGEIICAVHDDVEILE